MEAKTLTRKDVTILKGIGILFIFLHNYFHWTPGLGIENEFLFDRSNFTQYLDHAFAGPVTLVRYSLAYLGHFGVQLFVLSSGYGLYLSAQAKGTMKFSPGYLVPKLIKIFSLLLVGAAVIFLVHFLKEGALLGYKAFIMIIVGRMTSVWNFSYDTIFNYSGPFWFFGLIVQLYVLFPFLGRAVRRWSLRTNLVFLVISIIVPMVLYPVSLKYNVPLMGLFIGQLPVFLMGILLAKYGYKFHFAVLAGSLALFALGQYYSAFFTTTFPSIAFIMLAAYFGLRDARLPLGPRLGDLLEKLGAISMAVFILNGSLRSLALFRDEAGHLLASRIFIFIIILIPASIPLAFLYRRINALLGGLYGRLQELPARRSGSA